MMGRGKSKRIRRNEVQWRALLSRFSTSGLSVAAFCEREAVSTASFFRWRGLTGLHDGGEIVAVPNPSAFVDLCTLNIEPARAAALDLRLDLGGGVTLHLVRR